jgi:predicted transcriptional regulator
MNRQALHQLLDRIPDSEIAAAERYLEYLAASPAYRAAALAPADDESVTPGDAAAIRRALEDLRAGRVVSHEEVRGEFGLK